MLECNRILSLEKYHAIVKSSYSICQLQVPSFNFHGMPCYQIGLWKYQ